MYPLLTALLTDLSLYSYYPYQSGVLSFLFLHTIFLLRSMPNANSCLKCQQTINPCFFSVPQPIVSMSLTHNQLPFPITLVINFVSLSQSTHVLHQ